jgi:hypothetical protein
MKQRRGIPGIDRKCRRVQRLGFRQPVTFMQRERLIDNLPRFVHGPSP